MRQLEAMRACIEDAITREYDLTSFDEVGVDFTHLKSMLDRVEANPNAFSEAKMGRWLGYIQGVLVANGACTLEEMKILNKDFADDKDDVWMHLKRGSKYVIIGEARLQASTRQPADGEMLTLYRGEDGVYSVRLPEEFNDGRFERVIEQD